MATTTISGTVVGLWQAITHLNPMANDIDRLAQDVLTLKRVRHTISPLQSYNRNDFQTENRQIQ